MKWSGPTPRRNPTVSRGAGRMMNHTSDRRRFVFTWGSGNVVFSGDNVPSAIYSGKGPELLFLNESQRRQN